MHFINIIMLVLVASAVTTKSKLLENTHFVFFGTSDFEIKF